MNRIDQMFAQCRSENRKALIVFISAGDPSLEFTKKMVPVLVEAGADLVEIGVPFSDPMADGPTIQAASERAISGGISLKAIMSSMGELRTACPRTPFVLFSYYNLIMQYGVEKLARDSHRHQVDGWLVVDLPPEEEGEVLPAMESNQLFKIQLLAPNTPPERVRSIVEGARGFVYYMTVTGVTGARSELPADLAGHLAGIRRLSPVPVAAGFGISTPEQAKMIAQHADGIIVGSRLINVIEKAEDPDKALKSAAGLVARLAAALGKS